MTEHTKMTKWTPTTDLLMLRRMGKLQEELAECAAVAARCIIQGIDEVDPGTGKVNRQRLHDEMADVEAQIDCTISALGFNPITIQQRVHDKRRQMAEWEALFQPPRVDAPWTPRAGELVRYSDGSTALALHGEPHAGGWHGVQCMGGYTFYSSVHQPTMQDRRMWVESAIWWRRVPLQQAMAEAGLQLELLNG